MGLPGDSVPRYPRVHWDSRVGSCNGAEHGHGVRRPGSGPAPGINRWYWAHHFDSQAAVSSSVR